MGGDAVLRGDKPITGVVRTAAQARDLRHAESIELDSMARVGTGLDAQLRLSELHALGPGFPLRGQFLLADASGKQSTTTDRPAPCG